MGQSAISFRWLLGAPLAPVPATPAQLIISYHIIISSLFVENNTKAVIENCGQDKSGNSTYNCPKNRHKSITTIKHN